MPAIACPYPACIFVTDDVDAVVAAALLTIHNNTHANAGSAATLADTRQKAPKIDRPSVTQGCTEENWNAFLARWNMFKRGTRLTAGETVQQLFQCCEGELGDNILRSNSDATRGTEDGLLEAIKRLAVTPVAISVRRSDLLSIKQDHGENVRSFYARIKGKAATCAYTMNCPGNTCNLQVDFTDEIVKDVLISGLSDDDIRKDVLGWSELDTKTVNDTVIFVESKEMARDALTKQITNASITQKSTKRKCRNCNIEIERFTWNKRQRKMIEVSLCLPCWRQANPRLKGQQSAAPDGKKEPTNEASVITIASTSNDRQLQNRTILLDHHIFTGNGWKQASSMTHPTLKLQLTVTKDDYDKFGVKCPNITSSPIIVVTDTGAQSCLWSQRDFYRCGFTDQDLFPVKRTLSTASKEEINVIGAIFIRLTGKDSKGNTYTAPVMAYVSPDAGNFYLSRHACIQLGIIPEGFPKVGSADISSIEHLMSPCGCPTRALPPSRPTKLPFEAIPENNVKMREWLVHHYAASTFNRCPHQQLPGMSGPEIRLHINPNATPSAIYKPIPVPLHWQKEVEQQIKDDVSLGVLEEVPMGEASQWCHRMVLARKADGTPRRTVDLSPLNKYCLRETHHVQPPFQQAKSIPPMTWKTVTDAWNGYHSVPIHPDDRHLTTFLTPWGRYRYKMAPQGFLASGDGYARRFDEIIKDVPRKTKCVDDTAMWDNNLTDHWWRVIDFLGLLGNNGIVLNESKFQFAKREVQFAGFEVTEREIRPLEKFIRAIRDFPTPTKLSDVRSWFGLVNQVGHYGKLTELMAPFKPLLSPKSKFTWTIELEAAFQSSKTLIINAIKRGVEIFDLTKLTCLRPDWSKTGIGFYLCQKHCNCTSITPDCCKEGWKITLAGSRFLKPAETRYAPVEGEALAIAYALRQTKFFTLGCDNLVVVTDHEPLTKVLGDRTLDEISNTRLLKLKQRTLPWRFVIKHLPGKSNHFADTTSRSPVNNPEDDDDGCDDEDDIDAELAALYISEVDNIRAITWDVVKKETALDADMSSLLKTIESGFPNNRTDVDSNLHQFWNFRTNLWTLDGVIMMNDRILIPRGLRHEVLETLHAAHQGTTGMSERSKSTVFWPGITNDINETRARCSPCNRIAPSHPRTPPIEPWIPTTPFEAIACDYFLFCDWYYFVAADRLSGWTEQSRMKATDGNSGSKGLCNSLRSLFATFGVPIEVSSDGGPEFVAKQTKDFLQRWGVRHRISSAYFPSSNGRAELAVKSTKRLLMENVGPDGNLSTDKVVRALLTQRNTPDPASKLSPSQILFGRPLRDTLPYIEKNRTSFTNPQVHNQWRDLWQSKEEAMRRQYDKTLISLNEHSRLLPSLQIGDHVFIQNQTGSSPLKWDRIGVVMEVKSNDQYIIQVSGTGRLTLRNRRFLRKIRESSRPANNEPRRQISDPTIPPNSSSACDPSTQTKATVPAEETMEEEVRGNKASNPEPTFLVTKDVTPSPTAPRAHSPLVNVDARHAAVVPQPTRQSTRIRRPRLFYDPVTGGSTEQNP